MDRITIGFALTGSFCTIDKVVPEIKKLVEKGFNVIPIISESIAETDTRFGRSSDIIFELIDVTGKSVISTIKDAEPIGPQKLLDILIVAPCTGNTLAKIANSVTDTSVTMAVKAHLRNMRPVVIALATNDGLAGSAKNLGLTLNMKNIYFVPFGQDDHENKPNSLVADMSKIYECALFALDGKQIQPVLMK